MKSLPDKLHDRFSYSVGHADLASAIGNPGVNVVSSPALVRLLETACYDLIKSFYDASDATVGVHIRVDHKAAAVLGRPIEIDTRLIEAGRKKLVFDIAIYQGSTLIMSGEHIRILVSEQAFDTTSQDADTQLSAEKPEKTVIQFWFDFHSPWCYLAANLIGDLARRQNAIVDWKPVHLANLMDRVDGRRPLEANPAFVRWYKQDILDQAKRYGLPYSEHPDYPLRPSRALRVSLLAAKKGCAEAFVRLTMKAYWSEKRDISDLTVLGQLAEDCGLDPQEAIEAASATDLKAELQHHLDLAVDQGLFGLPAFCFKGKLFWGTDHLDYLESSMESSIESGPT